MVPQLQLTITMTLGANTLDRATNITPMGTILATLESMADGDGEADGPAGIEEPPAMADVVEEAALADTVKNGQTILAFA